jgi:hypothetical protein
VYSDGAGEMAENTQPPRDGHTPGRGHVGHCTSLVKRLFPEDLLRRRSVVTALKL